MVKFETRGTRSSLALDQCPLDIIIRMIIILVAIVLNAVCVYIYMYSPETHFEDEDLHKEINERVDVVERHHSAVSKDAVRGG